MFGVSNIYTQPILNTITSLTKSSFHYKILCSDCCWLSTLFAIRQQKPEPTMPDWSVEILAILIQAAILMLQCWLFYSPFKPVSKCKIFSVALKPIQAQCAEALQVNFINSETKRNCSPTLNVVRSLIFLAYFAVRKVPPKNKTKNLNNLGLSSSFFSLINVAWNVSSHFGVASSTRFSFPHSPRTLRPWRCCGMLRLAIFSRRSRKRWICSVVSFFLSLVSMQCPGWVSVLLG